MTEDQESLARAAYQAYGQVTNFQDFQGNPMPEWDALPRTIREGWVAASQVAYGAGREAEAAG